MFLLPIRFAQCYAQNAKINARITEKCALQNKGPCDFDNFQKSAKNRIINIFGREEDFELNSEAFLYNLKEKIIHLL